MADFQLYEAIETLLGICHDKRIFTTYPNLEAFHNRMKAIPQFAAHLASPNCITEPFLPPFYNLDMQMPQ